MSNLKALLRKIPWPPLLTAAVFLGAAPIVPEPHLVEKLRLLATGQLQRPIDIFDLFMHGFPALIVLLKLILRS